MRLMWAHRCIHACDVYKCMMFDICLHEIEWLCDMCRCVYIVRKKSRKGNELLTHASVLRVRAAPFPLRHSEVGQSPMVWGCNVSRALSLPTLRLTKSLLLPALTVLLRPSQNPTKFLKLHGRSLVKQVFCSGLQGHRTTLCCGPEQWANVLGAWVGETLARYQLSLPWHAQRALWPGSGPPPPPCLLSCSGQSQHAFEKGGGHPKGLATQSPELGMDWGWYDFSPILYQDNLSLTLCWDNLSLTPRQDNPDPLCARTGPGSSCSGTAPDHSVAGPHCQGFSQVAARLRYNQPL